MSERLNNSLMSYADVAKAFDWDDVLDELGWKDRCDVNLTSTIVDRHLGTPVADKVALRWHGPAGARRDITYRDLSEMASRCANLLAGLGVQKGDRIAALMPRVPETFAIILGAMKLGAIYVPIFTGFGPDGVGYRLSHSGARVVFTHASYRDNIPPGHDIQVVCLNEGRGRDGDIDLASALSEAKPSFTAVPCDRSDVAAIIYTSGSTGQAKGCVIACNLLAAVWPYIRYGVDLDPASDLFWPTGDPGWGYGLCCYLPAFAMGATVVCVMANLTPADCVAFLAHEGITNLATTPTLLRGLMSLGEGAVKVSGVRVRAISSCGEPLNGEVVDFFRRGWQVTPMDHYGATEFALPIGNYNGAAMAVKPGSMGLPCPGYRMAIVDEAGAELSSGTVGLIAQQNGPGSIYWLRYWNDAAATESLRHGDWICTGDLGRRDQQGYFWFEGRVDDMIKSAGYRIGPFEVESAMLRHPDVNEVAVVGKKDPMRGQIVKAFVVLRPGVEPGPVQADELAQFVKTTLGKHQYPREVEFVTELPKTETGKIQRFRLRAT
jgi:acetyl-CoA synthetase